MGGRQQYNKPQGAHFSDCFFSEIAESVTTIYMLCVSCLSFINFRATIFKIKPTASFLIFFFVQLLVNCKLSFNHFWILFFRFFFNQSFRDVLLFYNFLFIYFYSNHFVSNFKMKRGFCNDFLDNLI